MISNDCFFKRGGKGKRRAQTRVELVETSAKVINVCTVNFMVQDTN